MQTPTRKSLALRILSVGLLLTALRLAYVITQQISAFDNKTDDGRNGGSFYFHFNIFEDDKQYELSARHRYNNIAGSLKPRHAFKSYGEDIQMQMNKTSNPKLRKLWTRRDWRSGVDGFSGNFQELKAKKLLKNEDTALCIGARVGQAVVALKEIGVSDAIGIDLVAYPPLVLHGNMHRHPFADNSFDFEFSDVFDHALFSPLLACEIQRTLKPGGIAVVHVSVNGRGDRNSANDLYSVDPLIALFNNCEIVYTKEVDGFGVDIEIVLRKNDVGKCSRVRRRIIEGAAEDLIEEEPAKPWIALKRNLNNVKYLPAILDSMDGYRNYVYIDVGARNYASSIGSWFEKRYRKRNRTFQVYAIEADPAFHADYRKRKGVQLLPYAAWVSNETVSLERSGIGRILPFNNSRQQEPNNKSKEVVEVQAFDFAEWVKRKFGSAEDYVVMKMDVEGLEFDLVERMVETGSICAVDEVFLECHYNRWQRCCPHQRTTKYTKTYSQCLSLFKSLRARGILAHQWW